MTGHHKKEFSSCYSIRQLRGAGWPGSHSGYIQHSVFPQPNNFHSYRLEIPPADRTGWVNERITCYDPSLPGLPVCLNESCAREVFQPLGNQPCLLLFASYVDDPAYFLSLHMEEYHGFLVPYTEAPFCHLPINTIFEPYKGIIYYNNHRKNNR